MTPPITDEPQTILVTQEEIWIWPIDDNGSTAVLHVYPGEFVSLPSEDDLPLELPTVVAQVDTVSNAIRKATTDMCEAEDETFPLPEIIPISFDDEDTLPPTQHAWGVPAED